MFNVCCEDGRLLGNNVPSVNIYINASNSEGVRFSALDLHDVGMYSHTYIHIPVFTCLMPANCSQLV